MSKKMSESLQNILLVDAAGAAKRLSISRAHFLAQHSSGKIGPLPVKLGRRTLWGVEALRAWVNAGCPDRETWLKVNSNNF